jgi:hypothetical protein
MAAFEMVTTDRTQVGVKLTRGNYESFVGHRRYVPRSAHLQNPSDRLALGESGFHYCSSRADVFRFQTRRLFDEPFHLVMVRVPAGARVVSDGTNHCCSALTVTTAADFMLTGTYAMADCRFTLAEGRLNADADDNPSLVLYDELGDVVTERRWHRQGILHRGGDGAAVESCCDAYVWRRIWMQDGLRHRDDDRPALVEYHYNGAVRAEHWYHRGRQERPCGGPLSVYRSYDGSVVGEDYDLTAKNCLPCSFNCV